MLRAALRFGVRSTSLLAGGWLLRALSGTAAAVGASPREIRPVVQRSPQYTGEAFVNIEPASPGISMFVTENAPPGTVSKATFDGDKLTLEYYDEDGMGTFFR